MGPCGSGRSIIAGRLKNLRDVGGEQVVNQPPAFGKKHLDPSFVIPVHKTMAAYPKSGKPSILVLERFRVPLGQCMDRSLAETACFRRQCPDIVTHGIRDDYVRPVQSVETG